MARPNLLRQKLAEGKTCFGPLFQEFWSPELFEWCGLVGFDFVAIDGEHAGVDPQTARNLARAAQAVGCTALVRVPKPDAVLILQYLDAGIEGVLLSHCNTVQDVEALVRAAKFPPRGIRGAASSSRAALYGFGQSPLEHVESADREVLCIGLIEEPQAVDNLPEMLKVDGFDGCFLGPGDMALLMGRQYFGGRGPTLHPEVKKRVDHAFDLTMQAGKLVMVGAGTGAEAREWSDRGARLITVSIHALLRRACEGYFAEFRGQG